MFQKLHVKTVLHSVFGTFFAQMKRHLILIGLPDAWKLQEPFMILVGGKSDSR